MNANTMRDLDNGDWAEMNPFSCPCRNGWLLSDFDTWHRCPIHGGGVPHPEDDPEDYNFDYSFQFLENCRKAFAEFRKIARANGFKGSFNKECQSRVGKTDLSMKEWVCVAEDVAEELAAETAEEAARRAGFSCALERNWTEDAEIERRIADRW